MDLYANEISLPETKQTVQETEIKLRPNDVSNYKQMCARIQKAERQAYWTHIENLIENENPDKDQNPGKQEILVIHKISQERQLRSCISKREWKDARRPKRQG